MAAELGRLTLTMDTHCRNGRAWIKATAWGPTQGRYGSIASIDIQVPADDLPKDPEELIALLLQAAVGVVYSS